MFAIKTSLLVEKLAGLLPTQITVGFKEVERVPAKALKRDWNKAVEDALTLARAKDAGHIPGWCGSE